MKDVINIAPYYKEAVNDLKVIGEVEDIQNETGLDSYDRVLFYAGCVVKAEIKNVTGINTVPLSPDDISFAKAKEIIPKCLISLLSWMCGTSDYKEQNVLATAQDIKTVASGGKKMLPKHVDLAISLKNNLRSKEYITLLNKNGHCISYDEDLAIETLLAEQLMSNGDSYATLPSNIQSSDSCLVHAIADNGDYGQEENSQHITNIVLVKPPSITEGNVSDTSLVKEPFPRRRSIKITPTSPLEVSQLLRYRPQLPPYYASTCVETLLCQALSDEQIRMRLINQAWMLARNTSVKHFDLSVQHVPGWMGFHATISSRMSLPTTVGNCRSIPAAPTDMDVIYTMLYNVHKMLSNLNQNHQVLTFDEEIYEIAKDVQWKVSLQFKDIIICLGGFHHTKKFLGVIGRRM